MNFKALIFIALALTALATDDSIEALQKMESTKFGKTILATIQIQLQSGDSVDILLNLLANMEESIVAEQHAADAEIQESQRECFDTLTRLTEEIAAANAKAEAMQEELAELIPLRNIRNQELKHAQDFVEELHENLLTLEEEKNVRDGEWAQVQADHTYAVEVLTQTKNIIQGGLVSFVQLKTSLKPTLAQVSSHLIKSTKSNQIKQKKGYRSIFKVLSQITSSDVHANQEGVNRIIDLIDELLDRLANSLDQERRAYNHFVDYYTETKEGWLQMIADLLQKITDLQGELNVLNKKIDQDQKERAAQSQRSSDKTTEKTEKILTCDDEASAYEHKRTERDDQKSVISNAIGLINSKLRILKQYIANRK